MEFIGIGEADWIEQDETSSRKVVAILLDINFLIENWTMVISKLVQNAYRTP